MRNGNFIMKIEGITQTSVLENSHCKPGNVDHIHSKTIAPKTLKAHKLQPGSKESITYKLNRQIFDNYSG